MSTTSAHSRHRLALLVLAGLVAVTTVACGGAGRTTRPVVLAASSVGAAVEAIARTEGLALDVSPAGSQVLAAQVRAGIVADLVVLADPELARALASEGLASEPVVLARNGLALVVRDPAITLADLARLDLTVVLADPVVPLGDHTADVLGAAGVAPAPDSLEDNARSVALKLLAGSADAVVVYRTDARALVAEDPDLHVTEIGPADVATLTVQVLASSPDPGRAVRLLDDLRGERASALLRDLGFAPA